MVELGKTVNIKHPIDPRNVSIQKDPIYLDAFLISLPLDSEPSYIWQAYFEQELRASLDFWERKVVVVGNEIKLVTTSNDIEKKLDWLEMLVTAANKKVEEYNRDSKKKKKVEEIRSEIEKTIKTAVSRWLVRRVSA